jgi:undecaprenyl phosphate-alpha-L-ara4N flippase subunit ArnE
MSGKLAYLGLAIVIAANVAGQILFKVTADHVRASAGDGVSAYFANPWIWLALALYGGAILLWIRLLQSVPLSAAYPAMALVFVLVPLAGVVLFHEVQGPRFFAGVALIAIGVWLTSAPT